MDRSPGQTSASRPSVQTVFADRQKHGSRIMTNVAGIFLAPCHWHMDCLALCWTTWIALRVNSFSEERVAQCIHGSYTMKKVQSPIARNECLRGYRSASSSNSTALPGSLMARRSLAFTFSFQERKGGSWMNTEKTVLGIDRWQIQLAPGFL